MSEVSACLESSLLLEGDLDLDGDLDGDLDLLLAPPRARSRSRLSGRASLTLILIWDKMRRLSKNFWVSMT